MKIQQTQCRDWNDSALDRLGSDNPDLVLVFGSVGLLNDAAAFGRLHGIFPNSAVVGCSTAGEITAQGMADDSCVVTTLSFSSTKVRSAHTRFEAMEGSEEAGKRLAAELNAPDLRAVLVFGKGLNINGSALIAGLMSGIPDSVPVSGGLGGDGGAFARTLTLTDQGIFDDAVAAVGLYGSSIQVGHGSFGGWQPFGPVRKVTKSVGNVLYELDGRSVLDLYKEYLGEYAKDLPASGLLFPFEMLDSEHRSAGLIRTILGIDEEAGSLILAGDIDADGYLRLMHANNDGLVDGAEAAALKAKETCLGAGGFGLLVSCVGRKLVMGDAVDDEVEAVSGVLGRELPLAGFYSYGEIAPFQTSTDCKLHNQTMTVTFISEA